jgi:dihydroxyacetone kinase phosphotransfer subunit
MVGIVIVSHSAKVAEGIRELALQMAAPNQQILAAGGMADQSIGTDAMLIKDAIVAANSGDGVVVMVDLGSAVLSAELAIEMLEDQALLVKIADAPILEGTIAATVEASVGRSLSQVVATAEGARDMHKQS